MKRSTNSENLIIVTAIAMAITLLASACGPGNTKTLKAKTGLGKITGNTSDTHTNESEDSVLTDKEAIDELLTKGNSETPADATAALSIAERLQYIQYLPEANGSIIITVALKENDKTVISYFENGTVNEDGSITYSKAVKSTSDNQAVSVNTNLSIKVIKQRDTLSRVFITEKSADGKKSNVISVIVKLSLADAQVTSAATTEDPVIVETKNSNVSTRITQVYVGTEKAESKANRILITVSEKETASLLYSVVSVLSSQSNQSEAQINSPGRNLKEYFAKNEYAITLDAGTAVIEADQLSLKFVNKTANNLETNVLLTLHQSVLSKDNEEKAEDAPAAPAAADAQAAPATDAQTQDDPSSDFYDIGLVDDTTPIAAPATPDFSNVSGKVTSTEKINKPSFKNVVSKVSSTEAVNQPSFKNVTSKPTTKAATQAPKPIKPKAEGI